MKIKRMTATFGKLERAELTLADGLNIIQAPNEAGKSTWCGFLRAMFYGVETSQRDKKGFLAEKNRYAPWSGAPMEGELELEWQGRDITLRRFAKGSAPFGGFSAVYTDTQQEVPGLTGDNCGRILLGVGREVWERSAFVGQAPTLAIDGTPELEKRIAALFSSGQEDVSYSDTRETLGKWLRRRKHNKSGLIPQMEEELAGVDITLTKLSDAHSRFAMAQRDIARLEQEQSLLEGERQIHARIAARKLNTRYAEALQRQQQLDERLERLVETTPGEEDLLEMRHCLGGVEILEEQLRRAQSQYEQAEEACERAKQSCPDHPLAALTRVQMDDLCQLVQQMQGKSRTLSRLRFVCLVVALCLGVGLSVLTLPGLPVTASRLLGAGVAALVALGTFVPMSVVSGGYRRRAQSVLDQYGVSSVAGLMALWQEKQALRDQLEQAEGQREQRKRDCDEVKTRWEQEKQELSSLLSKWVPRAVGTMSWAEAIDKAAEQKREADRLREELAQVCQLCEDLSAQGAQNINTLEMLRQPEHTPEQTTQRLTQVERDLTAARSALALAQGETLSMGDRAQLEAKREALCARLDRRRTEYAAIERAIAVLDQANDAMQQRFAPQLNQLASRLLGKLTGGRYESLALSREFEASARSADGLLPHAALALSRGTADQIYLAVRLAVCQLCLPGEDASPVVLDDALLTFDDGRMAAAVEMLLGMDRQVLLFSCQQREAQLGVGNILSLQS